MVVADESLICSFSLRLLLVTYKIGRFAIYGTINIAKSIAVTNIVRTISIKHKFSFHFLRNCLFDVISFRSALRTYLSIVSSLVLGFLIIL